jgi:plastocyanin
MKRVLIACVAVVALAIPGAAISATHARAASSTYTVLLGEQGPPPAALKKLKLFGAMNQFMPSKLVIAAGDKVSFSSGSFHSVTYNPKPIPLLVPDPAKGTYAGLTDAAGNPFYFDDLPKIIYNLLAFGPFGPKTISGSTPASSGAIGPQGPKSPPATATYTFPKPGTYHLFCTLHPGMKATVVVKAAGAPVPLTPDQVKAEGLAQMTAGYAKALTLFKSTKVAAPNTVAVGVGSNIAMFAYFPKVLKVKAGTTVNFVNKSPSEVHNLTFGPPKYLEQWGKQTDLQPTGPKSPNQITPIVPYGTDPKPLTFDGATTHGNGFFATPIISGSPIPGLGRSSRVTFSTPGTYKYFCWIHGPDMSGTIVVTP